MSQLFVLKRWWFNAWPHRWHIHTIVPRFLRACPEPFRGEVLEVGAGRGWTSRRILETFPQVELTASDVAVDDSEVFDSLLEKYGRRLRVEEANVLRLPFDRDAYDIVIAINVVRALKPYGARKAIQQMLRVLRPGGMIGVSDYMFFSSFVSNRAVVEEVLKEEGCDILFIQGGRRYSIWARKQYPISPE